MSIYNLCTFCKTVFALDIKCCPKCKNPSVKGRQKYKVDIMVGGRRVTKVCPNITAARDIEAKVKTDVREGQFFDRRDDFRLREVWERYHITKAGIPRIPIYEGYFERFFSRWAEKSLRTFKPHDIELFINELRNTNTLRGRPYTEATIKSIITFLSSLFNYAHKVLRQKVDNPCDYIEKPREVVTPFIPLTAEQKRNLIAELDKYDNAQIGNMIRFFLATGMRRGEVFKLRWSDVDFGGRRLLIFKAKSGRNEVIPLSDTALIILEDQKIHVDNELVFPSPVTGKKYTNIDHAWKTIKKAAEIPAATTLHKLRHQFASDLVNTGSSLYIVGKLLRHSKTETTKIYAHLIDDTLRDAIKKIE